MRCDVLMDFDTLLNTSAFEFLNAFKIFKSNNGDLCEIEKIKIHVSINEDLIKLFVDIITPNNKFETIEKSARARKRAVKRLIPSILAKCRRTITTN